MASASDSRRRCTLVLLALLSLSPLCLAHGQEVPQPAPGQPAAPPAPRPQPQPLPFPVPFPAPTPSPGPAQVPPPSPAPPSEAPPGPTEVAPPAVPGFPSLTLPGLPPAAPPGAELIGPPSLEAPIRSFRFAPVLGRELGPLRVVTSLGIQEEFTDNANQTRDNRKSEFSTSIAPALLAHIDRAVTTLDLVYALNYNIPNNRSAGAAVNQNLSLRGGWRPTSRLQLGVTEDFTTSTDFRDVGDITARRTGQSRFITNTAGADVSYVFSPWRAFLSYSNNFSRDEARGGDTSWTNSVRTGADLTNPGFSLGASYSLTRGDFDIASPYWAQSVEVHASRPFTPRVTGTMSGSFSYQNQERAQDSAIQDFAIYGGNAGAVIRLTPDSSLSFTLGGAVFAPRFSPSSTTPTASITYTKQFAHFSLSAQYVNAFRTNFTAINSTGVTQTRAASVTLSSLAIRDLVARLSAIYAEDQFKQNTVAGGAAGGVDRTWNAVASLEYFILRWLSFTLGYTFTLRTSSNGGAEWYENRVQVGLRGSFLLF